MPLRPPQQLEDGIQPVVCGVDLPLAQYLDASFADHAATPPRQRRLPGLAAGLARRRTARSVLHFF